MKKLLAIILTIIVSIPLHAITPSQASGQLPDLKWAAKTGAKKIPHRKKVFNVSSFGARNDGTTLNTKAIQAAIDACALAKGGIVTFDTGSYMTGSLFIKKGVTFNIGKNTTILGSQDISDYPEIDTRIAGVEMKWPAALINVLDQENAALTGEGKIFASGKVFWNKYWEMRRDYEKKGLRWIVDYDCKRPRTLLISRSSNVTVKGITLQQAGF